MALPTSGPLASVPNIVRVAQEAEREHRSRAEKGGAHRRRDQAQRFLARATGL
jgi:hypothetical protein